MSAEYALRMEVLRAKREDLYATLLCMRASIRYQQANLLRVALGAQHDAAVRDPKETRVARSDGRRVQRRGAADPEAEMEALAYGGCGHEGARREANDAYLKQKNDLTASSVALELEKRKYFQRIEAIYPAWQEKLQATRLQQLKVLEEKKRAVEKRRYLVKKTFEKEQSLDDLIRQTNHEIELSENLERNEAYERELLRKQSVVQADRLDHTIREHAIGARSYLAQQARKQIREAAEIDGEVAGRTVLVLPPSQVRSANSADMLRFVDADKLFETFSPRSALNALKQADSSLSFSEYQGQVQSVPLQRSVDVEIPYTAPVQVPVYSNSINQRDGRVRSTRLFEGQDAKSMSRSRTQVEIGSAEAPLPLSTNSNSSPEIWVNPADSMNGSNAITSPTSLSSSITDLNPPPIRTDDNSTSTFPLLTKEKQDGSSAMENGDAVSSALSAGRVSENLKCVDMEISERDLSPDVSSAPPVDLASERSPTEWEISQEIPPESKVSLQELERKNTVVENLELDLSLDESKSKLDESVSKGAESEPAFIIESVPKPADVEERVEEKKVSPIEKLSMADKVKALGALISRAEEGATDGDRFSTEFGNSSTADTKRELVRMAAGGRKAQISYFNSDVCFELILEFARELGPVLFPSRAFEGIVSEQKIKKVHQNSKDKELELWKLLSNHIKQMTTLKALSASALADAFGAAFLHYDPSKQRSQRKMRELLSSVCGASLVSPRKDSAAPSPSPPKQFQPYKHGNGDDDDDVSPSSISRDQPQTSPLQSPTPRFETPSLLQTAFLQHHSPPPQPKAFGLASSGLKKKTDSNDVLKSMASSPTKLSRKLMRGGKMGDYSEFEEDEVDLQNLIGSKSSMTAGSGSSTPKAFPSRATASAASSRARVEEDNDFDVDF